MSFYRDLAIAHFIQINILLFTINTVIMLRNVILKLKIQPK